MTDQHTSPNPSETPFPTGIFTYTVGEYSPIVEIDGQGKMTITLNGEIIVTAKYQVMDDVIEVVDEEGSHAVPEYGVGRYKWGLEGKILTFAVIEDKLPSRSKSFAVPWHETS